jgi:thymidine kinase
MSSNQEEKESGYLEIIIGPMFSGKTSKLLEIYKQCKFCNIPVVVINYDEDKRYHENLLSTHDKIMIPCMQVSNLRNLMNLDGNLAFDDWGFSIAQLKEFSKAKVILINEAQFFENLIEFVKFWLKENKKIYLAGLDGDFKREKFGELLDLIPFCDKITKLNSLCGICKDGTPGIFSLRLTNEEEQKLIGSYNYTPVCRSCYNSRVN